MSMCSRTTYVTLLVPTAMLIVLYLISSLSKQALQAKAKLTKANIKHLVLIIADL
jgi:hypothetical protein